MVVYCRSDHCNKTFSTIFNRNKHEKKKGHGPKDQKREIPYDAEQNLFSCPSAQCETSAKYKYNIVKHLKSCNKINKKKKVIKGRKNCKYCDKTFTRKSSCDRHMRQCRPDEYPAESGAIDDNLPPAEECYDFPTMVDVAGPSRYEKTEKFNIRIIRTYGAAGHGKGVIGRHVKFRGKEYFTERHRHPRCLF